MSEISLADIATVVLRYDLGVRLSKKRSRIDCYDIDKTTETVIISNETESVHGDNILLSHYLEQNSFYVKSILSPENGIAIYINQSRSRIDQLPQENSSSIEAKALLIMFGLHSCQADLESEFQACYRNRFQRFCYHQFLTSISQLSSSQLYSCSDPIKLSQLVSWSYLSSFPDYEINQVEYRNQILELFSSVHDQEDIKMGMENINHLISSSLANSYLYAVFGPYVSQISNISIQRSNDINYQRIVIYMKDRSSAEATVVHNNINHFLRRDNFGYSPSIHLWFLEESYSSFIDHVLYEFWNQVRLKLYVVNESLRDYFSDLLKQLLENAMKQNRSASSQESLRRGFHPSITLSSYFDGRKGSGKSSFVKTSLAAIESILIQFFDPLTVVKPIYIHLNKSIEDLTNEFYIQQNNNDKSIMSIISGQESTISYHRSSLLALIFEEMPENISSRQHQVTSILMKRIAQRVDRLLKKNSRQGESSYLTFFTSNYSFDSRCQALLASTMIWSQLSCYHFSGLSLSEMRKLFVIRAQNTISKLSHSSLYLEILGQESFSVTLEYSMDSIDCLLMETSTTDIRVIYRLIDSICFWSLFHLAGSVDSSSKEDSTAILKYSVSWTITAINDQKEIIIKFSDHHRQDHFFSEMAKPFSLTLSAGHLILPNNEMTLRNIWKQLGMTDDTFSSFSFSFEIQVAILSYVFQLHVPSVFILTSTSLSKSIISVIQSIPGMNVLSCSYDIQEWKMSRSLNDPIRTPNIRDDLRKHLIDYNNNSNDDKQRPWLLVELKISGNSLELQEKEFHLRDLIEDIPSSTSFTSAHRALTKDRMLFLCVFNCINSCDGNDHPDVSIEWKPSPEIISRASYIDPTISISWSH